jgi:excisionase family DNA binding protein
MFEYLTVGQVAARAAVCPRTVRRWVSSGRLPARRTHPGPRGRLRIRWADVERLLAGEV